jgi:pimeloyl-ACP methyl ester carboxylesterase
MPTVYTGGEVVSELGGRVVGGTTVAVHSLEELDGLRTLCELAPSPPTRPLVAIRQVLESPDLDLGAWTEWRRRRPSATHDSIISAWRDTEETSQEVGSASAIEPPDSFECLLAALDLAHECWRADPDDACNLVALLTISEEGDATGPLTIEGDRAALMFSQGSLLLRLAMLPLDAAVWSLVIVTRGGLSLTARSHNLSDRARERAQTAGGAPLAKLESLTAETLRRNKNQGLVVFVHGIFSTDVGTFGELPELFASDNRLAVAGFPHQWLDPIELNARLLAQKLEALAKGLPKGPGKVVLICHSRGGLVARTADLMARELDAQPPIAGCVTFGTPHLGSPLAAAPATLLAIACCGSIVSGSGAWPSLVDALLLIKTHQGSPGVQQLRPPDTRDTYLWELMEKERQLYKSFSPAMHLLMVGGDVQHSRIRRWMSHLLGTPRHDLVVPLESALPEFTNAVRHTCSRSHTTYFRPLLSYQDATRAFVYERLGLQQPRPQATAPRRPTAAIGV